MFLFECLNHQQVCWLLSKYTLSPLLSPAPVQSLWSRHHHGRASPGLLQHLPRGLPTSSLTHLQTISSQQLKRSSTITESDHTSLPSPKPPRVSVTWRIKSELPTKIFQAFQDLACLPASAITFPMFYDSMHPTHAVPPSHFHRSVVAVALLLPGRPSPDLHLTGSLVSRSQLKRPPLFRESSPHHLI